ncbi:helix-turn-helix domain-containing protein [Endozoicomonas sp. Mp262]|uniref:helix-turn-helix domain-containing protein n=1 Tax=Endozoicomonas sp. Mp262 TaxID=2919499 RepID=UPI0021D88A2D
MSCRKGVWIPSTVWESKELSWQKKVLIIEINTLHSAGGCHASNAHFASFAGLSKSRIETLISELKKDGWVNSVVYRDEKKVVIKRVLSPTSKTASLFAGYQVEVAANDTHEKDGQTLPLNSGGHLPPEVETLPPESGGRSPQKRQEPPPENGRGINTMNNTVINTVSCSELKTSEPANQSQGQVLLDFPTNKKGQSWLLTEDFYQGLQESYPAVDVKQQLLQARMWLVSNPSKRKTSNGMSRFLNNWMSKEQNKGGGNHYGAGNQHYQQSYQNQRLNTINAIWSAPGAESLPAEQYSELFGERPVQDHAIEETPSTEFCLSD